MWYNFILSTAYGFLTASGAATKLKNHIGILVKIQEELNRLISLIEVSDPRIVQNARASAGIGQK